MGDGTQHARSVLGRLSVAIRVGKSSATPRCTRCQTHLACSFVLRAKYRLTACACIILRLELAGSAVVIGETSGLEDVLLRRRALGCMSSTMLWLVARGCMPWRERCAATGVVVVVVVV